VRLITLRGWLFHTVLTTVLTTWVLAVAATPDLSGVQVTDSHQRPKPGPGKPLAAQRELYFRLMKQGLTNSEACRRVGIHRSTGQHWRHVRRLRNNGREYYYRPVAATPNPVSARFLSEDERVRIADLHRLGWSIRVIAHKTGRDPSTISRARASVVKRRSRE
jgi:IS30 family transposase